MLELLTHTLLVISNGLLVPVILAIFGLLIWTLLLAGGFVREWLERRKLQPVLKSAVARVRAGADADELCRLLQSAGSGLPRRFTQLIAEDDNEDRDAHDQALLVLENDVAASLARHSFITRIAPIFGLMGTLIPLGPALNGLAKGDMQALSGNLIVAFTATVVGLLISGLSYGMGLARRVWYARDLTDIEFLIETVEKRRKVQYA